MSACTRPDPLTHHAGQDEATALLVLIQEGLVALVDGAGLHLAGAARAGASTARVGQVQAGLLRARGGCKGGGEEVGCWLDDVDVAPVPCPRTAHEAHAPGTHTDTCAHPPSRSHVGSMGPISRRGQRHQQEAQVASTDAAFPPPLTRAWKPFPTLPQALTSAASRM